MLAILFLYFVIDFAIKHWRTTPQGHLFFIPAIAKLHKGIELATSRGLI